MKKFFIATTIPKSFIFFESQMRLWKESFDVCLISSNEEELSERAKQEGVRYKVIPMKREISLLSDCLSMIRLIIYFIKERPYIVHGNTPKASMLSMFAAWMTFRPIRIYMCHGLRYETTSGILLKILKYMEWVSCHCATQVIAVSQGVCDKLVSDGICKKDKIKVVGYGTAGGIDVTRFSRGALINTPDVRSDLNIPCDAFVFCFVGRIVKDKGVNELVAAFDKLSQQHNRVYLLLIGPEEGETDSISSCSREVINTNKFIYALGRRDDVRPYIAASTALVLPSYREGVGQVILEANALDVPCIATDIIGPRDVIEPLVNGELVPPRNSDALYAKMKEWVDNPDRVNTMSSSSRTFVEARFKQEAVRNAYYTEYCKLANLL